MRLYYYAIALFVLNGMKQSGFASVGRFFFLMNSQKVYTAGRGGGNVILYSRGCRMHAAAPPPPTTTSIKLGDRAAAVAASADLFSNQWMGRVRVVRIVVVVVAAALVRLFQTCMVALINWPSDEKTTVLFRDERKIRFPETTKILLPRTPTQGHFRLHQNIMCKTAEASPNPWVVVYRHAA